MIRLGFLLATIVLAASGWATLRVEVGGLRSSDEALERAEAAMAVFTRNAAALTRQDRQRRGVRIPFSLPQTVVLTSQGRPLPPPESGRGRDRSLTIVFDTSGGQRSFTGEYRSLLQAVFDRVRPTLDIVFGQPAVGGEVLVANYDAEIGDRDAVAGGFFVPNNGQGRQEIRFPVYQDSVGIKPEVAAVNFVHTLLLAYIGPNPLPGDAFQEGLVRAATLRIVRTPGALPAALDRSLLEGVLEATYDAGPFYDWWNQRALAGRQFIAENLRNSPLPDGGSVGGLYLVRYLMAGSAWQKVAVEYPGFLSSFVQAYFLNPDQYQTRASLVGLGQSVLQSLGGSTVEGRPFADWARRQFILDTTTVAGTKLMVQPFPISSGLSGDDFGVFGIQAHLFLVAPNGDETLLSGTSYPIYWSPDFVRFFAAAQDDRIDLAGGYGAVAPNFPDSFGGQPYRVTVDIPASGEIARAYLPAGGVATASRPTPNEVYGTVVGLPRGGSTTVQLEWGVGATNEIVVSNGAFGARITDATFLDSRVVLVSIRQNGQRVLARQVNKGPGPLALDLRVGDEVPLALILRAGLNLTGISAEPWVSDALEALGTNQAQVARYNSVRDRYDLYPESGTLDSGKAFYVRVPNDLAVNLEARRLGETPLAVHLRPGWNMITTPLRSAALATDIQVVSATSFPAIFGTPTARSIVQSDFFTFTPGAADPFSRVPETGTLTAATVFEPGRGYLVRVFAPDGATLLFSPFSRGREGGEGGERERWLIRARLHGVGGVAEALFGARDGASRGFAVGEDSEIPPSAGGLEVALDGERRMYRDLRAPARQETYTLRVGGLRRGTSYRLELLLDRGAVGAMVVRDRLTRQQRRFAGSGVITFTARQTVQRFDVTVRSR